MIKKLIDWLKDKHILHTWNSFVLKEDGIVIKGCLFCNKIKKSQSFYK